ncbi:MAG: hypothetical protein KC978_06435 [Candidatus Omnitrophica bacterium]|nr:hypothetical protein [Candidatus Omnitrophota bacterium]
MTRRLTSASFVAIGFLLMANCSMAELPRLDLPEKKIEQVYRNNWVHTLEPCKVPAPSSPESEPEANVEPLRPWKVEVNGHYPGWYPGVDVKHQAAAYLACEKNLPLVLRGWELTKSRYLLEDGSIRPMTFHNNPHNIVPETTVDGSVVYYPLRSTANIDFLLLGDMIFRFSQDREWLAENLPAMRKAAAYLEGWVDDEGLLHSDSYDLDQVYRQIDGVAQAAACHAFRQLALLESVLGNEAEVNRFETVASRLSEGVEKHFWSDELGYYYEHLVYNDIAQSGQLGSVIAVSSKLGPDHDEAKAIDGVVGIGIDGFQVGVGAAGNHEWATDGETSGAWIQIGFGQPIEIGRIILFNRTDPKVTPGERFARGRIEFSDGSDPVEVQFNDLAISRAEVSFTPREVSWIKFTGTEMEGEGGGNAGLAEVIVLPSDEPYRKITHGMADANFALVGYEIANSTHAESVWNYFRSHESAFYSVNNLAAPTWIAEKTETYGPGELNRRAPYKDCVAMARIWRYDAMMRRRMRDGAGLIQTIGFANILHDRPSGGGPGFFAERYDLGRFEPGDEAQATVPKYTGYPSIYNSTIVQQTLLGLNVDVWGTIEIDPCVPSDWYEKGFGEEGCGILLNRDLGFHYFKDRMNGWIEGSPGVQKFRVQIPPNLASHSLQVLRNGKAIKFKRDGRFLAFNLSIDKEERTTFEIVKAE